MSAVIENPKTPPREVWLVPIDKSLRKKISITDEIEEEMLNSSRYEMVYGEIRERTMPNPQHGRIQAKVATKLGLYLEQNELGIVYTETNFEFAKGLTRVPDIAFISFENFPTEGEEKGSRWHIPPDLAIEVISPSDIYEEVQEKIIEYFTFGVKQVWIISPESKTLTVYHSLKKTTIYTKEDELICEDILPEFHLQLGEIFQPPKKQKEKK
ncbi:MAG: Uma2 family endonuclease [Pyrinomonadaceae bacterium]|nr:Uma2 family endonuclease [Pyrinomonadaceae bacterium]